ncbi:serine hydrolase [Panacibacter ginsenosidivorans]|uniref:Serine hydrolase n=1 Tax=Panacibacter ginsenosidivorans TaxID=1813871 RepID=A0A5B8VFL1_9BACT|nr:serine hydrolase [Panacibacter ginsenosidivorans]QEC69138.1 serine hydrolase [Panacibacter ginsenosidivorans]
MMHKLKFYATSLFLLLCMVQVTAQKSSELPVSVPEKEGVSSAGIINFLDATAKSKTEFHSFMMLRHGKIIAEGWWNPYRADLKHTMYSCSKSFTATAIGFAVNEKLLTVNDKVISFFPNDLPDTVSTYLSELTVKDVLSMSDGMEPDPTFTVASRDSNWVKGFLATPILHKPGTTFLYNSLGTYMLSAIVQKVTGQRVIDYLKPRLFDPLGITGMDWEVDPKGINTGGWGLRIKTEDMAKFGQLFLQKGMWNGKHILPAAWVEEASTVKIIQHPDMPQSKRDSSEWEQGYCYQMWRCRHNAYRGDGAFGQYIIVMPDQDAVIAITAETPNMQEEINLVWQYLLPAMQDNKLPDDKDNQAKLTKKLASLALPVPAANNADMARTISGNSFQMEPNAANIQSMSFSFFRDNSCILQVATDTAVYRIHFAAGKWEEDETLMHGPSLVAGAKASFAGLPALKTDGACTWKDEHTLELTLRYIESPHTEKITCHFDGETVTVDMENSFDYGSKKTTLKGRL